MQHFSFSGSGGRLKSGSRRVTELAAWTAELVGEGRLRVEVKAHVPDPFWWEHHDPSRLRADLSFGREGIRGPAVVISPQPLVIEVTQEMEA